MKRALITWLMLAWVAGSEKVCAQGTVNFSDFVSGVVFSHVYGPEPGNPNQALAGNVAAAYSPTTPYGDYPAGQTVYHGCLLGGSGTGPTNLDDFTNGYLYTAQLWAAPGDNQPESELQPAPQYTTTLRTGPMTNGAGFFAPLSFTSSNPDPGIPNTAGGRATCQLRVWYNAGGAIGDWETAMEAGVLLGASPVFNVDDLPCGSNFAVELPSNLEGLQSFNIHLPNDESEGAPIFVTQPDNASAPLGGSAQFLAEACGADFYQWQFNGANLTNNARISGAQSYGLTINGVCLADAGSYQATAWNYWSNSESAAATLTVTVPQPSLQMGWPPSTNGAYVLNCSAAAGQRYQIQYATNLAQPTWVNLGSPVACTNGVITIKDIPVDNQRFYRAVFLPQ
jgi:hypothetical protein